MKKRKKIAVMFGGCSPEYEVSLESAYGVLSNLNQEKYEPVMIGISREGEWFLFTGRMEDIRKDIWQNAKDCRRAALSFGRNSRTLLVFDKGETREIVVDGAFPVLHGKNGEDGTVQGALLLAGIPLIGCSVLSSALCMDKDRAHRLAEAAGVSVPRDFTLSEKTPDNLLLAFADMVGYPLFVKPVRAGSSYGITKVCAAEELFPAVKLAFSYDDRVIVEEFIDGFEVGCALLGTQELTAGEADEVELSGGFFDFTEKYELKTSAIHVPARISREKAAEVKETAKVIYKALDCRGFARVDMFLAEDGRIVFNEVNTIPGFTEHSRFPGMMRAAGISLQEVLDRIIGEAVGL